MDVLVLSLVTNMVIMPENAEMSIKAEVEQELVCLNSEKGTRLMIFQSCGNTKALNIQPVVSHDEVLAMGLTKADMVKALVMEVTGLID